MEELVVDLNRSGVNTVEPRRERVEAADGVLLRLQAHGRPARVHLRVDGEWSETLSLPETNLLVTPDAGKVVELVPPPASLPTGGTVWIEAGYGTTRQAVAIDLKERTEDPEPGATQQVDDPPQPDALWTAVDGEALGVVGVLLGAVITAITVVAVVGPQLPVVIGAGLVVGTAIASVVYLYGYREQTGR